MIIVLGSVVATEGKLPEALALSREHVTRSRTEAGCIAHAVHQDAENPQRLVFVEEWSDQTSLLTHFKVPASKAFAKALASLAAEPPSMSVYQANELPV